MADMRSDVSINRIVSHLPGVVDAVSDKARDIAVRAEAKLSFHREQGQAQIVVEHGKTDSIVSLVDRAAMSIEFGHYHWKNSTRYVPGLYIITGAAHGF